MEEKSRLVISTHVDVGKEVKKGVPLCILLVVLGVLFTVGGGIMYEDLNFFSSDIEELTAMILMSWGGLSIVCGILLPSLLKFMAIRYQMDVYEDHIEGKGNRLQQGFTNFHENHDRISSVSTGNDKVSVHLKDGGTIQVTAHNAPEVANAIRQRI